MKKTLLRISNNPFLASLFSGIIVLIFSGVSLMPFLSFIEKHEAFVITIAITSIFWVMIFSINYIIKYKKTSEINKNDINCINQIVISHTSFNMPDKIASAKKHIILHAAFYPKYGEDHNFERKFKEVMMNNKSLNIKVVITDEKSSWAEEFGKVLRSKYNSLELFKKGIHSSIYFFCNLKAKYKERVKIYNTQRLPLVPMVIIDDEIFVGHYCHAEIIAPEGYWLHINSQKVSELVELYESEARSEGTLEGINVAINRSYDIEEKAISRYVQDAYDAIKNGNEIKIDKDGNVIQQ